MLILVSVLVSVEVKASLIAIIESTQVVQTNIDTSFKLADLLQN